MFGTGLIIIGIVLLLQTAGAFAMVPSGLLWGIVFILVGLMIILRRSVRRRRRREWIEHRRANRPGGNGNDNGSDKSASA